MPDFTLLDDTHDLSRFDCGERDINRWIRNEAIKRHKRFDSRVRVTCPGDSNRVEAFYSLQLAIEDTKNLQGEHRQKFPHGRAAGFPCIRLQYLGVTETRQRQGLGSQALLDAVLRASLALESNGGYAIVLQPIGGSEAFYEKLDFEVYGTGIERRMILPYETAMTILARYRERSTDYDRWLKY
ncbi:GNAT family N-acetyltransferase [Hyphobacterium marinum]|uniref:GNAT family N-acetyltransferase n=1 Tax=Hyphobacterium marinum TaxID=3116574 RepID=A0ABU7M1P2_9PROT|nr:GNAT family N-acetyltransferase [Hyphobacterium sp. Y6023]MEE2567743.1 GNAT family N-acetyltransferase [Hyphobacterium sp. Y6023]